jgi:sugar phosphate isomerase/epimerase
MQRRTFLKTAAVAAGFAAPPINERFKVGAISDGFSQDFEDALKILSGYGLRWVEIRNVYGVYNTEATAEQVQQMKELLKRYQFRVSVIDSALYKCGLPGTTPLNASKDIHPFGDQMELLKRACERAHTLGADKIRGFTFWRVADLPKVLGRISEELAKASAVAKREGMRLVIENEETCNAGTGAELAQILKATPEPNLGANWDVGNGYWHGEVSFPDGYKTLDKGRIWHMHLKGVTCGPQLTNCAETMAGTGQIDLAGQFRQLIRDRYHETMSLECEFKAPGLSHLETSKRSLEGLLKVLNAVPK